MQSVNKQLKPVIDVYSANVQPRLNRVAKHPLVARAAALASSALPSNRNYCCLCVCVVLADADGAPQRTCPTSRAA